MKKLRITISFNEDEAIGTQFLHALGDVVRESVNIIDDSESIGKRYQWTSLTNDGQFIRLTSCWVTPKSTSPPHTPPPESQNP
jgi:hypothetical protein